MGEIPGKRHCSASKNGRQASASRCRRFPIFFRVRLLRLRGIEKRTPIYRTLTHLVQINRCPRLLVPWILRLTCLRGRRKQGKYVWKGGTVRVRCRHRASVAEFIRFLGQDRVWRSLQLLARDVCNPALLQVLKCKCTVKIAPLAFGNMNSTCSIIVNPRSSQLSALLHAVARWRFLAAGSRADPHTPT